MSKKYTMALEGVAIAALACRETIDTTTCNSTERKFVHYVSVDTERAINLLKALEHLDEFWDV